ncbi:MAG: hypothetical protein H0U88_09555 [Chthoniobacterales bacterium]|nr:hypothetical protein [Chthoniobacterales bacterium]
MHRKQSLSLALALGFTVICAPNGSAQIERGAQAHGGLAKWRGFGTVEFDSTFENARGLKKDHQLFNLRTRDGLITAETYTLGASKGEVWIKPALDSLGGTPPRFYIWTPFYFFGMPFVFADPGAVHESLGKKMFQEREYDVVKITFQAGTGDSSEDFYVAYFDAESGKLKLASYVVTYPSLRKGKPIDQLEQHAIVFQEWQDADGLIVPKVAQYFDWKNDNIEGEALGNMSFLNVRFSGPTPDDAKFVKPPEALIAPRG